MVTIFEFFALMFVIGVPVTVGQIVAGYYGVLPGVAAGILSAGICATVVFFLYRSLGRRHKRRRDELRENYRGLYRVRALPIDPDKVQKPERAEIRIGDYAWEAEPLHEDGLVYLQGLTAEWRVVWYAGFRSDQIERIGAKPQSQYDWKYSWVRNPPPCPFPVQSRNTPNAGFPMVRSTLKKKSWNEE